jgi:hypothetical protein
LIIWIFDAINGILKKQLKTLFTRGESMIIDIGIVAGEIWHYLDKNGESPLSSLIKGIKRDRDISLMSLGWLAREGHVILSPGQSKGDLKVQLRK